MEEDKFSEEDIDEELLIKLVRGLEDIRKGRFKKWDDIKNTI